LGAVGDGALLDAMMKDPWVSTENYSTGPNPSLIEGNVYREKWQRICATIYTKIYRKPRREMTQTSPEAIYFGLRGAPPNIVMNGRLEQQSPS
jgi:hypothetical protein